MVRRPMHHRHRDSGPPLWARSPEWAVVSVFLAMGLLADASTLGKMPLRESSGICLAHWCNHQCERDSQRGHQLVQRFCDHNKLWRSRDSLSKSERLPPRGQNPTGFLQNHQFPQITHFLYRIDHSEWRSWSFFVSVRLISCQIHNFKFLKLFSLKYILNRNWSRLSSLTSPAGWFNF